MRRVPGSYCYFQVSNPSARLQRVFASIDGSLEACQEEPHGPARTANSGFVRHVEARSAEYSH